MADMVTLSSLALAAHTLHWISGLSLLALGIYCFRHHRLPMALPLSLLSISSALWGLGAALIFVVSDVETKILINRIKMIGVAFIPYANFYLVISVFWSRFTSRLPLLLFSLFPVVTTIILLGPWHELIITGYDLWEIGEQELLIFTNGRLFPVHHLYANLLMVFSFMLIALAKNDRDSQTSRLKGILAFAVLFPFVTDLLGVLFFENLRYFQVTPAAMLIMCTVLVQAVFREQILNLIPYARGLVMDSSPDIHLIFNYMGYLVDYNPSAEKFLGIDKSCIGVKKEVLVRDYLFLGLGKIDLKNRFFERSERVLSDQNGREIGSTIVFKDITFQERLNQGLREVSMVKTQLLGVLGHDLQSHLSSLSLLSEGLSKNINKISREDIKAQTEYIHFSTRSCIDFVEQLLTWTKSHLGSLHVKLEVMDFKKICTEVINFLHPTSLNKNINFHISVEIKNGFISDEMMLKIIIRNLLSNAIRFSPLDGDVSVRLKEDADCFTVEVSDQGKGADYADIQKIIHAPLSESSGLGLFVCREFARRLGGTLFTKQSAGDGITFVVQFPTDQSSRMGNKN